MRTAIENALNKAWKDVQEAYENEKINSERALQAVLYRSLTNNPNLNQLTVLVEPTWAAPIPATNGSEGQQPDIVIVNKKQVLCVLELKCAPHWWIQRPNIIRDLQKLEGYRTTKKVRLDIFGPDRKFDSNKKKWIPEQTKFEVVEKDVVLVFVGIAISNKNLERESYEDRDDLKHLLLHPHFRFVCGAIDEKDGKLEIKGEKVSQKNCRK